jgi:hypothetical protein
MGKMRFEDHKQRYLEVEDRMNDGKVLFTVGIKESEDHNHIEMTIDDIRTMVYFLNRILSEGGRLIG